MYMTSSRLLKKKQKIRNIHRLQYFLEQGIITNCRGDIDTLIDFIIIQGDKTQKNDLKYHSQNGRYIVHCLPNK